MHRMSQNYLDDSGNPLAQENGEVICNVQVFNLLDLQFALLKNRMCSFKYTCIHCKINETYLLDNQLDGIGGEFGMLLHDFLNLLLLQILDLHAATEMRVDGVGHDGGRVASHGLPGVLLIVVALGNDLHAFRDEVCRVEIT